MSKFRVAAIGCGDIFRKAYVPGIRAYANLELVACADLDVARAQACAKEFNLAWGGSVDELLKRDGVDGILNLTIPKAHAEIDRRILEAGKHAYSEKPLALDPAEAKPVIELAKRKGLRIACAPDTFLGAGIQTARAALDAGDIGRPVSATAFMACPGHESWHPSPEFYYHAGGGPMLDMGPYYLTALVNLFGPVRRVAGFATKALPQRLITSQPKSGTKVTVEVETHLSCSLEFVNGAIATVIMSFDTIRHSLPCIEVHGTEGSLSVPDPNGFGGTVRLAQRGKDWVDLPKKHAEWRRGAGMSDLALAVEQKRPERCAGAMALHVLEVMDACHRAGRTGTVISMATTCDRPAAVPAGLAEDAMA